MTVPSPDAFAALARSSPWRWRTLRFTVRREGSAVVRAWLRRPDLLRVEAAGGALVQVVRDPPRPWLGPAEAPVLRPDGLVAERPWAAFSYTSPMFDNYRWVAMLDPFELADGRDPDTGEPDGPPLLVDAVLEVQHAGRPAWEAVVRTTGRYDPLCGCCPLLRSRETDLVEFRDHPENVLPAYPDAYRVRLDVGTGVCVFTEEIGGLTPGAGHDLRIEAVDEPMGDGRFVLPRRRWFRR